MKFLSALDSWRQSVQCSPNTENRASIYIVLNNLKEVLTWGAHVKRSTMWARPVAGKRRGKTSSLQEIKHTNRWMFSPDVYAGYFLVRYLITETSTRRQSLGCVKCHDSGLIFLELQLYSWCAVVVRVMPQIIIFLTRDILWKIEGLDQKVQDVTEWSIMLNRKKRLTRVAILPKSWENFQPAVVVVCFASNRKLSVVSQER